MIKVRFQSHIPTMYEDDGQLNVMVKNNKINVGVLNIINHTLQICCLETLMHDIIKYNYILLSYYYYI